MRKAKISPENDEIKEETSLASIKENKNPVIKLPTPITWGKKEITEIVLDKDKLNAGTLIAAEAEFKGNNPGQMSMNELSHQYCLWIASIISEVEYGALLKLDLNEFLMVVRHVQSFLMHGK